MTVNPYSLTTVSRELWILAIEICGDSSSGISSLGKAAPGALSSRDSSLGFISFTYGTAVPIGAASSNIPSYSVSLILISSVSSAAGLNKFTSKYF